MEKQVLCLNLSYIFLLDDSFYALLLLMDKVLLFSLTLVLL